MAEAKTIFIEKKEKSIDFYLRDSEGNTYYLCSQKPYSSLYDYFKTERRVSELVKGRKWPNRHVRNMLDKLPKYIKYTMKYEAR